MWSIRVDQSEPVAHPYIKAELQAGERVSGVVCPGDFIYHYITLPAAAPSDGGAHQRHLAAVSAEGSAGRCNLDPRLEKAPSLVNPN